MERGIELSTDVVSFLQQARILTDTALFYHDNLFSLPKTHEAWKYLEKRDLSEDTAKRFMLGYSGDDVGSERLFESLMQKHYPYGLMEKLELVYTTQDYFGPFRIIMPIFEGTMVKNISSRLIRESTRYPKYKHLRHNSYTFYGYNSIKTYDDLFLCEGQIDRLTLEQGGLNAASFLGVASANNKITKEMIVANRVYCIPDIEESKIAWKTNIKSYIKIHEVLRDFTDLFVIKLPQKGNEKVDSNSFFNGWKPNEIRSFMYDTLVPKAKNIQHFPEYYEYKREKQKTARRKLNKDSQILRGESLLKTPIVNVFEDILGMDLEKRGEEYVCRCINPEHEDKTPSLRIYPRTNTFFCWTCKEWGDSIGAVALAYNMNWKEATTLMKERLN